MWAVFRLVKAFKAGKLSKVTHALVDLPSPITKANISAVNAVVEQILDCW